MKEVESDPAELFEHLYAEKTPQLKEQAAFLRDELAREEA
jgi:pyruvate dehydrogenase E1 component alpha subunit